MLGSPEEIIRSRIAQNLDRAGITGARREAILEAETAKLLNPPDDAQPGERPEEDPLDAELQDDPWGW